MLLLSNPPHAFDFFFIDSDLYNKITEVANKYSPICRVWAGPVPVVFINDPDCLQKLLNHPEALHKGVIETQMFNPIAGKSLLLSHRKYYF